MTFNKEEFEEYLVKELPGLSTEEIAELLRQAVEAATEYIKQLHAAIELAADDELVCFARDSADGHIKPVFLVNDCFAFACADGEPAPWSLMPEMLERVRKEGWPAVVKWVADKRNIQPMKEVVRDMDQHAAMLKRVEHTKKTEVDAARMRQLLAECQRFIRGQACETAVAAAIMTDHPGAKIHDHLRNLEVFADEVRQAIFASEEKFTYAGRVDWIMTAWETLEDSKKEKK